MQFGKQTKARNNETPIRLLLVVLNCDSATRSDSFAHALQAYCQQTLMCEQHCPSGYVNSPSCWPPILAAASFAAQALARW